MTVVNIKSVKRWMIYHIDDYMDCGELNCTGLAEAAADEFDLYEDDTDYIPEIVFELASELAAQLSKSG